MIFLFFSIFQLVVISITFFLSKKNSPKIGIMACTSMISNIAMFLWGISTIINIIANLQIIQPNPLISLYYNYYTGVVEIGFLYLVLAIRSINKDENIFMARLKNGMLVVSLIVLYGLLVSSAIPLLPHTQIQGINSGEWIDSTGNSFIDLFFLIPNLLIIIPTIIMLARNKKWKLLFFGSTSIGIARTFSIIRTFRNFETSKADIVESVFFMLSAILILSSFINAAVKKEDWELFQVPNDKD